MRTRTTSTGHSGRAPTRTSPGRRIAYIRTLLGLIPPDQIDDSLVAVRIPHEFVHLVFDTASSNPYHGRAALAQRGPGGLPERGLRVGTTGGAVERAAAKSGTLIPLDGLTGQFPNGQDFFLAYSESVGAVDYMVHDVRQRRAGHADPLVRRGPDRRRGLHRRARPRHDRLRRGVVQGASTPRHRRSTDRSPAPRVRCRTPGRVRSRARRRSSPVPGASNGAPAPVATAASAGGRARRAGVGHRIGDHRGRHRSSSSASSR